MINYRNVGDGILAAPKRGKPPPCPEGYNRATYNDYIFILEIVDCPYRTNKSGKTKCGGTYNRLHCTIINYNIKRTTCHQCKGDKDWILNYLERSG